MARVITPFAYKYDATNRFATKNCHKKDLFNRCKLGMTASAMLHQSGRIAKRFDRKLIFIAQQ